ncbi:MAG: response regulator transcription factor [Candidatus Gastranaerophilales bacterium]|nr:response regulator transcription factor [Candidatus Gastranaerophilales bacterium]
MQNNICNKNIQQTVRLILIDDHKLFRCGIKSLFENKDGICVVAEAANGKEGIAKILAQNPDVVLLDLELEDINGLDLIEKVMNTKPGVKFIILTSHINEHVISKAMKMGIYGYILKDINSEFLDMIVRSVSNGAMWIDKKVVQILRELNPNVIPNTQISRSNFKSTHANLTAREYEVLKLVVDGKSNLQIANELNISEHTSKAHVCNIIQKLVVDDRTQAAVKAIREGIV